MIKIIIIIFLIYLIYKIPQFIEPFSESTVEIDASMWEPPSQEFLKCNEPSKTFTKKDTLDALKRYPGKSIDPLFDATFKPECCPSTYTSSSGCLCYEPSNFNIIATRGGNILSQTFINTYSNKCIQSS